MYIINSCIDKPDIDYMRYRVREMAERGFRTENLGELYEVYLSNQRRAAMNIQSKYGINNPNSHNNIKRYFDKRKDDFIERVCYAGGKFVFDKHCIKRLAKAGYEEAVDFYIYRKFKKYAETINSVMQFVDKEGVFRPKITFSKTNRVNYIDPALMNIPKDLLWKIVKPRKVGNIFISVDIKNQEPWIMINMLGIERLINLIKEIKSDEDFYSLVFKDIFGRLPDDEERGEIKICWNALTYGASAAGIKDMCFSIDTDKVYLYFNSFPEYKRYKGKCFGLAKSGVQCVETYFGTKVWAEDYGSRLQRVLMDIPIQGTGSDILALLIERFDREIYGTKYEGEIDIAFTRHDELILEANKDLDLEEVKELLKDIFEHCVDDWVPFRVKISVIDSFEEDKANNGVCEEDF